MKANEVVHLTAKKRSLFGLLLLSALRSLWTGLTTPTVQNKPTDAKAPETKPAEPAKENEEPRDEELARFIAAFKVLRDSGYTLKIIPGTPEENAPSFALDTVRRAA